MEITFTVPGRPVPAVRMTQRGKYVKPQAQRYLAYKDIVGWTASAKIKTPMEGPVGIEIRVVWSGKGHKADIDNLTKGIMDAVNMIVWHDDKQVDVIRTQREIGEPERVEVRVWQISETGRECLV